MIVDWNREVVYRQGYDRALQEWCKEHDKDFMQFTMKMHKMLKEEIK